MSQTPVKLCVLCGNRSELLCSRCNDSYCSIDCQRQDWQRHRHICFKMPTLVPDLDALETRLFSKLTLSSQKVDSLTLPTPPPELWPVQALSNQQKNEMPIERKKSLETIKRVEPPTVKASIEPPKALVKKPETVVAREPIIMPSPMQPTKSLIIPTSRGPTNAFKNTTKVQPPQRMMLDGLNFRSWPESKNIKVKLVAIVSDNIFYLRENNRSVAEYFEYISTEIGKYCKDKKGSDYKPTKGEVVLGLFEGEWYRAAVIDVTDDGVHVQYIEYGNFDVLKPSELIQAPTQLKFDVCARLFVIDNIPDNPENLNDKQREILSSEEITITGVHKGTDSQFHCQIFGF